MRHFPSTSTSTSSITRKQQNERVHFSHHSSATAACFLHAANGDNPYRFYTWKVTYGDIYPLGVKQQEWVAAETKFMAGRNVWYLPNPAWEKLHLCASSKRSDWTYFYFPSLALHKAAGGYGSIKVYSRPRIPVPYPPPAGDHVVLAGDWFKRSHRQLKYFLDGGHNLPFPDGLIINGRGWNGYTFNVDQGTHHELIEVEGSHTLQTTYSSLDVHLGQSYSVLVTADQPAKDYYVVVSSRFTSKVLTTTAVLHYRNSFAKVSGYPPGGPTTEIDWSLNQARSIRWNLTASGPRPNPQGSYHYGLIKPARTIILANSAPYINGKQRYAVNGVRMYPQTLPLKLADYFNIGGVFSVGSIPDRPNWGNGYLATSVMHADYRSL
ncbi:UNVERIFIED_CONTAM: L-ascorbate oxidase [Sesamum radiatum]|uniref:L-ascorbate oxidase n=1 Tax=Sesamum radiatum TaxID=300843 RepID=A0AAW2KGH4_SESRA